jgi:catechol-2,3-dioxygenase
MARSRPDRRPLVVARAAITKDDEPVSARIGNVAFDCDDVLKVAAFWSKVLGRPIDDGGSELFASIGGSDGDRAEPAWYFNKVRERKRVKNRVHLDLVDPDARAVAKFVGLGATVVGKHRLAGHRWTVMQDPEANEFCVATKSWTG